VISWDVVLAYLATGVYSRQGIRVTMSTGNASEEGEVFERHNLLQTGKRHVELGPGTRHGARGKDDYQRKTLRGWFQIAVAVLGRYVACDVYVHGNYASVISLSIGDI
jgi:hypothetical protein